MSNSQDGYVQTFLRWLGGSWIQDYEMSGQTGLTKGKNIQLVMERNRINRAVYVGDTQMDAAAAEAGIPFSLSTQFMDLVLFRNPNGNLNAYRSFRI